MKKNSSALSLTFLSILLSACGGGDSSVSNSELIVNHCIEGTHNFLTSKATLTNNCDFDVNVKLVSVTDGKSGENAPTIRINAKQTLRNIDSPSFPRIAACKVPSIPKLEYSEKDFVIRFTGCT